MPHDHVLLPILNHLPLLDKWRLQSVCRTFRRLLRHLLQHQTAVSIDQSPIPMRLPCNHRIDQLNVIDTRMLGNHPLQVLKRMLLQLPNVEHVMLGDAKTISPDALIDLLYLIQGQRIRCIQLRDLNSQSDSFVKIMTCFGSNLQLFHCQHLQDQRMLKLILVHCDRLKWLHVHGRYRMDGDLLSMATSRQLIQIDSSSGWHFHQRTRRDQFRQWLCINQLQEFATIKADQLPLLTAADRLRSIQLIVAQHNRYLFLLAEFKQLEKLTLIDCRPNRPVESTPSQLLPRFVTDLADVDDQDNRLSRHLHTLFNVLGTCDWIRDPFEVGLKWVWLHCERLQSLEIDGLWLSFDMLFILAKCCRFLQRLVMQLPFPESLEDESDSISIESKLHETVHDFRSAFDQHDYIKVLALDCRGRLTNNFNRLNGLISLNSRTISFHIKP